jgi:hypothetical protein
MGDPVVWPCLPRICKVYPLLKYADLPVQRSLYHILRKSIQSRTSSLVVSIEADADVDADLPELPGILVELAGEARDESVRTTLLVEYATYHGEAQTNAGNLLAWLLIFEHFVGAVSSRIFLIVVSAYIPHCTVKHPSFRLHRPDTKRRFSREQSHDFCSYDTEIGLSTGSFIRVGALHGRPVLCGVYV